MAGKTVNKNFVVKVRNYDQARAALKAAYDLKKNIILENSQNSHRDAGFLYMKEVLEQAKELYPDVEADSVFDAGGSTIIAISAINCGFKRVRYQGNEEITEQLKGIADQKGAELLNEDYDFLDLEDRDDAYKACVDYMRKRREI